MSVVCSAIHVVLPTVGEGAITGSLEAHVESCIRCRSEVARYRSMFRELEALEASVERAPGGFAAEVMDGLGPVAVADREPRRDNRVPVAAAAAVATAAAGTAVLYRLYRQRAA
jgi:anti-sigma factor RsiW